MKNRKLLLIVSLVLALAVSLSSTLAYLTDTDSDVNVMTIGNVDIEQLENGENGPIDVLPLYPAFWTGDVAWDEATDIKGAVDKEVTVENVGNSDAYIRTIFAFEAGNGDTSLCPKDTEFDPYIHLDFADDVTVEWYGRSGGVYTYVIDGKTFYFACVTYPEAV